MFEHAAGLALVAGLYPPALLIAGLYLGSAHPSRMTSMYVLGGLCVVAVLGIIALLALRAGGFSLPGHKSPRYGLRLGLGLLALVAAAVLARRQPKKPDPSKPKKPSLIDRMSSAPSSRTAFLVGVLMFGPSVTFVAAVQVVATAHASLAATVGAMAMIFVLTLSFAWIPLLAYLFAPQKTAAWLRAFDGWLRRNGKRVLVAAVGLIGFVLVVEGVAGLT